MIECCVVLILIFLEGYEFSLFSEYLFVDKYGKGN